MGLEQGFDILRGGPGTLELMLGLSGNVRARLAGADGLALAGPGSTRMWYGGLTASDARGHALSATMALRARRVVLSVQARNAVYPITVDPFVQVAKIGEASPLGNTALGQSVAVAGTVAAASVQQPGVSTQSSAVDVFVANPGGWSAGATRAVQLTEPFNTLDGFGQSVAITPDGQTIVVGAPDANVGTSQNQGQAFVFQQPTGGWANSNGSPSATLENTGGHNFDAFGRSVSISPSGATIAVGAPIAGVADVFLRQGTAWNMDQTTPVAQLSYPNGPHDQLGTAVATTDDTVVAGAWDADQGTLPHIIDFAGQVAVFQKGAGAWTNMTSPSALLVANDPQAFDFLGGAVALSPDDRTIVAGTTGHNNHGAAYVWTSSTGVWSSTVMQTAELSASDASTELGWSVALDGSIVVAGAPASAVNNQTGRGAVYVFAEPASGWANETQTAKLTAADGAQGDSLGQSVSMSNATIIASAPFAKASSVQMFGQGFLYAFGSTPTTTIAFSPGAPDGRNGWYRHPVHVAVSAFDLASTVSATRCALDPGSPPGTFGSLPTSCAFTGGGSSVSSDGRHTLFSASVNAAGYTDAFVSSWAFKIDRTPPTVTCLAPPSFQLNGRSPLVGARVSDSTSGPAAITAVSRANVKTPGTKRVAVTGSDNAGNTTTVQCKYIVIAPRISASLQWTDTFFRGFTVFDQLVAHKMPRGGSITITCHGGGCPFSRHTQRTPTTRLVCKAHHKHCKRRPAPAITDVNLLRLLGGRHLAVGARLTFALTNRNTVGVVYSFKIRGGQPPASGIACLAVGSLTPGKGCS
jgi:hypothetical protein